MTIFLLLVWLAGWPKRLSRAGSFKPVRFNALTGRSRRVHRPSVRRPIRSVRLTDAIRCTFTAGPLLDGTQISGGNDGESQPNLLRVSFRFRFRSLLCSLLLATGSRSSSTANGLSYLRWPICLVACGRDLHRAARCSAAFPCRRGTTRSAWASHRAGTWSVFGSQAKVRAAALTRKKNDARETLGLI